MDCWQTDRTILECNEYMLSEEVACDILFRFGANGTQAKAHNGTQAKAHNGTQAKAHKFVLISRSPVFFAMFCGDLQEKTDEITIPDVPQEAFQELLRFLYCEKVAFTPDNVLQIMYAAKKYIVPALEQRCRDYLGANLNTENVCTVLVQSFAYGDEPLMKECFSFIDKNATDVVRSETFLTITEEVLGSLLERDTLNVEEEVLIDRTLDWGSNECLRTGLDNSKANIQEVLGELMYLLRFPTLSLECFAEKYSNKGFMEPDDVIEVFRYLGLADKPKTRFPTQKRTDVVPLITETLGGRQFKVLDRGTIDEGNPQWCYDAGADSIAVRVSKPIHLVGIGLWGASSGKARYNINVSVVRFNTTTEPATNETRHTQNILTHFNTCMTTTGSRKPYQIIFPEDIYLNSDQLYQVTLLMNGPDSFSGAYQPTIYAEDGVKFTFSLCENSRNGTSEYNGQIPQMLYHL